MARSLSNNSFNTIRVHSFIISPKGEIMKSSLRVTTALGILLALAFTAVNGGTVKSAGVKGLWSQPATWTGGVLPGPADLVLIANRDTVTIDTTFTVAGITVGEGDSTALLFSKLKIVNVYINGDLSVSPLARFSVQSNTISQVITDSLFITGNITSDGVYFDMRSGSVTGPTLSVCQVCFVGSTVSTVKVGPYLTTSNNEFNGVMVNKSGQGKVVLASDLFSAGGSTSAPSGDPNIRLIRGVIETGPYVFVQLYAASGSMPTTIGNDSSYILGSLGRGMSNSGTATTERTFQIGDQGGYRPVKVRIAPTGANLTGHYLRVDVIHGKANPAGTATFDETIDKVSDVRYYRLRYFKGIAAGLTKLSVDRVALSYGKDDGVAQGNTNLRIAVTDSAKSAWIGMGPTVKLHTTGNPDTVRTMTADSLPTGSWRTIDSVTSVYVALSRLAGTTENTLTEPGVYVRRLSETPTDFALGQNYPNPFNPTTTISYQIPTNALVTLKVFDVLGREVAVLLDRTQSAGTYTMQFDASRLPSGLYFYSLTAGRYTAVRKMMLVK
jgi:hypothetical protein